MKTMKIILIVSLILIALFVIVYAYYGGFKKIVFQTTEQGGETLVYECMTGDYKKSAIIIDKLYHTLLKDDKIETLKGFGIYLDNPQKVETSKLRSEIGCVVEDKDAFKLIDLKNKYKIKTFPKGSYIVTEFPNKGKLSVIVGIIKVYPAMMKYLKEQGYSDNGFVMEIYDTPNNKIIYRKEIIKK